MVNAAGMGVAEGPDDVAGERIGGVHTNSLEIFQSVEEVGIQQVWIQRILFNMLPEGPDFPGMPGRTGAINQALYRAVDSRYQLQFDTPWNLRFGEKRP
jgi:hypothetical protein